jgi:zinc transport system permease protein
MWEALQFEFFRNALAAGILASVLCGVIGTLVVVNRVAFLAGGVAHAAYGGIGMAFFFGWPVRFGTLGFALAAALVMAAVTRRDRERSDTVVGVLWAVGMAIGIVFADLTPGYNVDLMSYLFGSILAVPAGDLRFMAGVCFVVVVAVLSAYNAFLATSFDPEFARLRGLPADGFHFVLLAMIALSVVVTIQVVGLILVIAMLTIPPFIAERFSGSLKIMMAISAGLGTAFASLGLWMAYRWNLTSGAAIILVNGAAFFAVLGWERIRRVRSLPN